MKKVLLYGLSIILAISTVVVSSGMSLSIMRCHISGKSSFSKFCNSHQADQETKTAVIHQNCCAYGSYNLDVDFLKDAEFLIKSITVPALYSITASSLVQSINPPNLAQRVLVLRPPPELSRLQVFII